MTYQPHYTMTKIRGTGSQNIVEMASALNFGSKWSEIKGELCAQGSLSIFGQFDLKGLGSGDVASNLRYKHDREINNEVVRNTQELLALATSPITITSVPRSERYKSVQFLEDGSVTVTNKASGIIPEDTALLTEFLRAMGVTEEKMKILRPSTSGAHYNSYLADMLSFIYMMNSHYHPEIFDKTIKIPQVYNTSMIGEDGGKLLKGLSVNGRDWIPKDGFDYLYFEEDGSGKYGKEFLVPKGGSIGKVYHQLNELISQKESGMKKMVREFFSLYGTYNRFSDYWVNDVDDGFTMLMILNAYNHVSLTPDEMKVKAEIERVVSEVF